ncbi:MAG TPA: penicillin acylase family protein [Dehalococcoidia bacterium]|nr:penicillin acylase family protein [Dehalococcoidia bacterium]
MSALSPLRLLRRALFVLGLLVLASALLLRLVLRRSLRRTHGRLRLRGLSGGVEIIRDRWGVPHIYADNLRDLFLAIGYAQAQDRLWQLELHRRAGVGRLSEVFGPEALPLDRLVRRIGFHRAAQREWEEMEAAEQQLLEAYAAGVNACMASATLPPEFTLLRLRPEPWQPLDTLTFARFMNWGLAGNWEEELLRSWVVARFGAEIAVEMENTYPVGKPLTIPAGSLAAGPAPGLLDEYSRSSELAGLTSALSNAWAIAGTRSTTGQPLLANDPHLTLTTPSTWYEMHLECPEVRAAGVGIAGVPGIIIGHNQRVAWGVTAALIDGDDLFVERINPDDPTQYEYRSAWEQGEVVREEIRVRGRSEPVVEEILLTSHGPVVNQPENPCFAGEERTMALRTVGLERAHQVAGLLKLMQASDWPEFRQAARHWPGATINFVYADVDGNIGYQMGGLVPLRGHGLGLLPAPGWSGEYDWQGFVPFEELPSVLNPREGWVANANNQVSDDLRLFSTRYAAGDRVERIMQLLAQKQSLERDDFASMQADVYSAQGEELAAWLLALQPADHWQERAQTFVRAWDHCLTTDSVGASVVQAFAANLVRLALEEKLGEWADFYLGKAVHPLKRGGGFFGYAAPWLGGLMERHPDWFAGRTWRQAMRSALSDAIADLRERLGDDMSTWQWGRLHLQHFNHTLGRRPGPAQLFNRGPVPLGGDLNTLSQAAYAPYDGYDVNRWSVSWRQIIDLSDFNRSLAALPGGQSGHPASRHYDDLTPLWQRGEYHPMPWDRSEVERHAEARLELLPDEESEFR